MPIPRIFNVPIIAANEAHIFTFPNRIYGYQIQARTNVDILLAWQQGQLEAGVYLTLKGGDVYIHDTSEGAVIIEPNTTIYLACATIGAIIEIEVW